MKLNTRLSKAPVLGYVVDFAKAVKKTINYKYLLDESYKKVGSTFPAATHLFGVNRTTW